MREARAAARINSRAAVTVYDVVEEHGKPWIVMERLAATTLGDLLRREGALPAHRVARIGLHVLEALSAAHTAGVLHRRRWAAPFTPPWSAADRLPTRIRWRP